jgi:hypothetical protein
VEYVNAANKHDMSTAKHIASTATCRDENQFDMDTAKYNKVAEGILAMCRLVPRTSAPTIISNTTYCHFLKAPGGSIC